MPTKTEINQARDREAIRQSLAQDTIVTMQDHPIMRLTGQILRELRQRDWSEWETYSGLRDQYCRSVLSVASNYAEGIGRGALLSRLNFLKMARGSAYEAVAQSLHMPENYYLAASHFLAEAVNEEISHVIKLIEENEEK